SCGGRSSNRPRTTWTPGRPAKRSRKAAHIASSGWTSQSASSIVVPSAGTGSLPLAAELLLGRLELYRNEKSSSGGVGFPGGGSVPLPLDPLAPARPAGALKPRRAVLLSPVVNAADGQRVALQPVDAPEDGVRVGRQTPGVKGWDVARVVEPLRVPLGVE